MPSPYQVNMEAFNPYAAYQQSNPYAQAPAYPQQSYQPAQQQALQQAYPSSYPSASYPSADYYGGYQQPQQPTAYPQQQAAYSQPTNYMQQSQPQFQAPPAPPAMAPMNFSDPSMFAPQQAQNTFQMPVLTPPAPTADKYVSALTAPAPTPMEAPPAETQANPQASNPEGGQKPQKPSKSLFPRIVGIGALAAALYLGYRTMFKGDGNNADDLKGDNVFTESLKSFIQDKVKGANATEQDYTQLISELKAHNKKLSADDKISDGSFSDEVGRALTSMVENGEDESLKTKAEQLLAIKTKLEDAATQTPTEENTQVAKAESSEKPKTEEKKTDSAATKTA